MPPALSRFPFRKSGVLGRQRYGCRGTSIYRSTPIHAHCRRCVALPRAPFFCPPQVSRAHPRPSAHTSFWALFCEHGCIVSKLQQRATIPFEHQGSEPAHGAPRPPRRREKGRRYEEPTPLADQATHPQDASQCCSSGPGRQRISRAAPSQPGGTFPADLATLRDATRHCPNSRGSPCGAPCSAPGTCARGRPLA